MSMIKKYLCWFIWVILSSTGYYAQPFSDKVDANIYLSLEHHSEVEVILLLNDQADLSQASRLTTKTQKGTYVFQTLQMHAKRTQGNLKALLNSWKIEYDPLFIANAIYTKVDRYQLLHLQNHPDIKRIEANPTVKMIAGQPAYSNFLREDPQITWGIQRIKADSVWELGLKGEGFVVGGQDTGYDWSHPSISGTYRGNQNGTLDHNYNWYDAIHAINPMHEDEVISPDNNPCGLDSKIPCDDHNHGTHTMGTMVGEDGDMKIGVAPKATWIGCRCMERGYGTPFTYLECFEWFLAPTDLDAQNPDPSKAPHVINNSWGCPMMEGCDSSNFETLETAVNNLKSAGIVVVTSAGNSGNGCATIDDPPSIFFNSFVVGATRQDDTIAGFSSRGPVSIYSKGLIKPNISAPGVNVLSAVKDSGYQSWQGTSMAGPHVAGAVVLLLSANPDLAGQVEEIETILEITARSQNDPSNCGSINGFDQPNHVYGYGILDIYAAVEYASQISGTKKQTNPDIRIYPNPVYQELYLNLSQINGFLDLTIYDLLGKPIYYSSSKPGKIDASNWRSGTYFVNIKTRQGVFTYKVTR